MAQAYAKRHVRLALFGCVRCGRFLFAPSWYELDRDVAVCTCEASRYKTTNVRAPDHVQGYWDAQCTAAYTSYRRRQKRHAPPSVHAERVASDFLGWSVLAVADEWENEPNLDNQESAPPAVGPDGSVGLTSFQRQAGSVLHACRSALTSGLSFIADVERQNRGKT
jgi:hypothetical protein